MVMAQTLGPGPSSDGVSTTASTEDAESMSPQAQAQAKLMKDWRTAVSDLGDIDQAIKDLRDELQQFEARRARVERVEASLRKQLVAAGELPQGITSKSGDLPTPEPQIFQLDDISSRPPSLEEMPEDWEQGLDLIQRSANNTRDRATALKAHWLQMKS
mmetsp:Transcript_29157/g.53216  ORF Transcript_29157/g.53216 Transcript_29157/m.53216 type:complete len:159 (-) Transcript_29157:62-538(-)